MRRYAIEASILALRGHAVKQLRYCATPEPQMQRSPMKASGQRAEVGTLAPGAAQEAPFLGITPASEPKSIAECLTREDNTVTAFFNEKDKQMAEFIRRQNEESVVLPPRPEDETPEMFERVRRNQKLFVRFNDPDDIVHEQKYNYVELPPPKTHPWVERTKYGRYIQHGDGMLNVTGTGEVGFDSSFNYKSLPRHWRGLRRNTVIGSRLPLRNGSVLQDAVVKYSLKLTGRGLFATRDIKKGEIVMIVDSTAQNVGYNDEQTRLIDMTAQILRAAHAGGPEDVAFLHDWVLTGQLSSLVERWRPTATERVIELIGGEHVLEDLEIHKEHIPRIAAIIYMNSFLVESTFAERRGTAYWPEASLLNHSCVPNATYEIVPEHMFTESEFFMGTTNEQLLDFEESAHAAAEATGAPGAQSGPSNGERQGCVPLDSEKEISTSKQMNMTPTGARTYLFCCRASRDINAGEEILISYVPVEWPYDQRQEVLHDRYKFWCKCPRCAPTADSRHNWVSRIFLPLVIFSLLLRLLLEIKYAETEDDDRVTEEKNREVSYLRYGVIASRLPEGFHANDPYAKIDY